MSNWPEYQDPYWSPMLEPHQAQEPFTYESYVWPEQQPQQEALTQQFTPPPFPQQFTPQEGTWDLDGELHKLLRNAAQEEAHTGHTAHTAHTAPELPLETTVSLHPAPHRRRRRVHRSARELLWPSLSFGIVALAMAIFATVSAVSGLVTYQPLRALAAPAMGELASWWPLLVYGPWTAASLFILRSPTLRGRAARIAWSTLLLFSVVAGVLCIVRADKDFAGIAVAALPPIAAMACLQLLILHLTPSRPRHAMPATPGQTPAAGADARTEAQPDARTEAQAASPATEQPGPRATGQTASAQAAGRAGGQAKAPTAGREAAPSAGQAAGPSAAPTAAPSAAASAAASAAPSAAAARGRYPG